MKYPRNQFEILVKALRVLKQYINIEALNLHSLHFLVYQQFSEGQKHNRLVVDGGILKRKFSLVDGELVENPGKDVLNFEYDFKNYPEGCNDNHIETAMKKALKSL